MIILQQPSPARVNDVPDFGDRFWYWYGASGRRYIHSVYPAQACPALPGVVYISVQRCEDDMFEPLAVDVSNTIDCLNGEFAGHARADEIHVHMLAKSNRHTQHIHDDLQAGLFDCPQTDSSIPAGGFNEVQCSLFAPNEANLAVSA